MVHAVVGAVILVLAGAGAAVASELEFTYASRLPDVQGQLQEELRGVDAAAGLTVTKSVFALRHDGGSVVTHVAASTCGEALPPVPYIVAIRYLPRTFRSFAQTTALDGFREVYVIDEARRVRFYQNVSGYVMAELSQRFQPVCVGI